MEKELVNNPALTGSRPADSAAWCVVRVCVRVCVYQHRGADQFNL